MVVAAVVHWELVVGGCLDGHYVLCPDRAGRSGHRLERKKEVMRGNRKDEMAVLTSTVITTSVP